MTPTTGLRCLSLAPRWLGVKRWLLALLMLPSVAAAPLLVSVVPDLPGSGPGDEAIAIWGDGTDLTGWSLSDGEDSWPLPSGPLTGKHWFVGNATLWAHFDGPSPTQSGLSLRLGNDGDDVRLVDPSGTIVDSMAWGDGTAPTMSGETRYRSPGLMLQRAQTPEGDWVDTDTAKDWQTPRMHRVGESNHEFAPMVADWIQPYACPDHCLQIWSDLLGGAKDRVAIHMYDVRAPWLADLIVAAAKEVPVSVLVQERPVGMDTEEERDRNNALSRIEAAGGEAVFATRGRYAFHHLKVLVADDKVAIQSDNGVPSSFPQDPSWGSRGWGVVVHDDAIADAVWAVLAEDRDAWDVKPFEGKDAKEPLRFAPRKGPYQSAPLPPAQPNVTVQIILTPDMTADPALDPVLSLVRDAKQSVRVQQLDIRTEASNPLGWSQPDGLHEALTSAQERGVQTWVQAAAPFSQADEGNRPALASLATAGAFTQEFSGPLWLHNKGIVVDNQWTYVGSMNQNHHSRSNNRELGAIIHSPEAASWYSGLFDQDADAESDAFLDVPGLPWPMLFVGILVLGVLRR